MQTVGFDIPAYIWMRLPLVLMFANGYLVYRILVATGLTEMFVMWGVRKQGGSFRRILFYIIASTALLSFFIPNAITILIMLPVLKTIEKNVPKTSGFRPTTALTLSAIYGANIGGMGSLIGSPANLLLIGALDLYNVPGREQIGFLNWFFWSVPLVAVFAVAAWLMVLLFAVPAKPAPMTDLPGIESESRNNADLRNAGLFLFILFIAFWSLESVLRELDIGYEAAAPPLAIVFFLIFAYLAFVWKIGNSPRTILRFQDLIEGFPKRGILFVGILILVFLIVRLLKLDKVIPGAFSDFPGPDIPIYAVLLATALSVIFLTELLSNTVVSTAFFPIAYYAAASGGMSPIILMIAVSISSTCAFMTPIATPCNALAIGEMKGISMPRMLVSGFALNIAGAVLMTVWLRFVIPLIYGV